MNKKQRENLFRNSLSFLTIFLAWKFENGLMMVCAGFCVLAYVINWVENGNFFKWD